MGRRHDEIQGFRPERNLLSPFGKCEYEIIDLGAKTAGKWTEMEAEGLFQ